MFIRPKIVKKYVKEFEFASFSFGTVPKSKEIVLCVFLKRTTEIKEQMLLEEFPDHEHVDSQ